MKTGKTSWRVRLAATGGGIALGLGEGIEKAEKMTNQIKPIKAKEIL